MVIDYQELSLCMRDCSNFLLRCQHPISVMVKLIRVLPLTVTVQLPMHNSDEKRTENYFAIVYDQ